MITVTRPGIAINGGKLREARVARRWSTSRLAAMIECRPGHLRLLERGLRRPSLELLGRIEDALGVSARELEADVPDRRSGE